MSSMFTCNLIPIEYHSDLERHKYSILRMSLEIRRTPTYRLLFNFNSFAKYCTLLKMSYVLMLYIKCDNIHVHVYRMLHKQNETLRFSHLPIKRLNKRK